MTVDFGILFYIYLLLLLLFFYNFICNCVKSIKNKNNKETKVMDNKNYEEFVLCFRKTRIEMLITSRIEEISKTRDIQFVVSFFYYKNNKSIKGSIYVITSKIVYKLQFIKNNLISNEYHTFNTFISKSNVVLYNSIKNYLNENSNCKEKTHHTEFYIWPYYYFINNYETETKNLDTFLNSL